MKITAILIAFTLSLIVFCATISPAHAQETPAPAEIELHPALLHPFEILGSFRDGEVVISVDGKDILFSQNFSKQTDEGKADYLDFLHAKMRYCGKKGLAAVQLAVQATLKIDTAEDQTAYMIAIAEASGTPNKALMGSYRMINEAYRHGFKDPVKFAQDTMELCMIEGE